MVEGIKKWWSAKKFAFGNRKAVVSLPTGWLNLASKIKRVLTYDFKSMVDVYADWVFACANVRAESLGLINFKLYTMKAVKGEPPKREEVYEHPFLELIKRPNPFFEQQDFIGLISLYLDLTGNAYVVKMRNKLGLPAELWILPSQAVEVIPDEKKFIKGYLIKHNGKDIKFKPEDVIHFRYPNPRSLYYGIGIVEAAANSINIHNYMLDYEEYIFKNRANIDAVLESEEEIDDDKRRDLELSFKEAYSGVSEAGRVVVMDMGLKYKPVSLTPKEIDYLYSSQKSQRSICALFRVPPSALGIVEDVNRANAEATDYTFGKRVILPNINRIAQKLERDLAYEFDEKLLVGYENPIPQDKKMEIEERESDLKLAVKTINQVRSERGMPKVEWGDDPIIPINFAPLSMITDGSKGLASDSGKNEENDEPKEDEPKEEEPKEDSFAN